MCRMFRVSQKTHTIEITINFKQYNLITLFIYNIRFGLFRTYICDALSQMDFVPELDCINLAFHITLTLHYPLCFNQEIRTRSLRPIHVGKFSSSQSRTCVPQCGGAASCMNHYGFLERSKSKSGSNAILYVDKYFSVSIVSSKKERPMIRYFHKLHQVCSVI